MQYYYIGTQNYHEIGRNYGLVSQTGYRLSKDYATVNFGHLSTFINMPLKKTKLLCILRQNKGADIF